MTEIFNGLSVIGDAIEEHDRVVYLLASLPDSNNTLVTALEANVDVPKATKRGLNVIFVKGMVIYSEIVLNVHEQRKSQIQLRK